MKLVSFRRDTDGPGVGAVVDGQVVDLGDWVRALAIPDDAAKRLANRGQETPRGGMQRLLLGGDAAMSALATHLAAAARDAAPARIVPLEELTLLAPVPRPGKIVAIGRNYAEHARETGIAPPDTPRIIAKLSSSVLGPGRPVLAPEAVTKLDFEVELAAVIGTHCRHVERRDALRMVAGYTILDDVSAREFQFDVSPPQTTFAKSMHDFCPMGPWLVTRDELPDPHALALDCWLNGTHMQHGNTADLIFPVDVLIAYITRYMPLEPGDVIATGTPSGSGAFRTPPVWLRRGDEIRMRIEGIGDLVHGIG